MQIIIILILVLLLDIYTFKGFKELIHNISNIKLRIILEYSYWALSTLTILAIIFIFSYLPKVNLANAYVYIFCTGSIFMAIFIPKLLFSTFHFIEDILFLFSKLFSDGYRITIITKIGFLFSIIIFVLFAWGMTFGRFNFKIKNIDVRINNLPKKFEGFKIVQFSDLHIGSIRKSKKQLEKAINLINSTNPDIIVFTGDLVNNFAEEIYGFEDILKKLKSKYGKYSILGNHDYGEYFEWKSNEDKINNLNELIKLENEIGFKLLLNENDSIEIENEKIYILGVENWGKPPFPSYGDLKKSLAKIPDNSVKILLSHDPSHWDYEVKNKTNIDLTLSGHTHGMQFGINNSWFKWSPVSLKYKKWGGLYNEYNQQLFVSTGLGYIGFAGRVGINPEIVVITLKKSNQ